MKKSFGYFITMITMKPRNEFQTKIEKKKKTQKKTDCYSIKSRSNISGVFDDLNSSTPCFKTWFNQP